MSLVTIKVRFIVAFVTEHCERPWTTWPLTAEAAANMIKSVRDRGDRVAYLVRCQPRRRQS